MVGRKMVMELDVVYCNSDDRSLFPEVSSPDVLIGSICGQSVHYLHHLS